MCYNGKPNSRLESLHLSYLKRALGVKLQTSNSAVFGETGRCPIMVRQEKLVIGYWLKLMNTCPNNPLKLVYNELHRLSTKGYKTWCTHVGSLLKSVGMENIWDEQKLLVSVDNFKQMKAGFKNELENCYAQKWVKEINDINRHPILRTYIGFKNNFCQEKYIERLNIRKYQRAISRFRVSSHRLGIETGRHQKPSLQPDKRLCQYCKSGKVDDELHFLVHCDFHSKTRKLFFSQLCEIITDFHRLNDVDKFREILMSTNEDVIVSLGKFIYDGFKSRDQICINTSWNECNLIACFIPILWLLISCLLFTAWSFIRDITYCLNHSRHHKGVMVSAWQYLYIRSFYLFICSFYVILHVLYDSWVSYDIFVSIKWLLLLLVYMTRSIWLKKLLYKHGRETKAKVLAYRYC